MNYLLLTAEAEAGANPVVSLIISCLLMLVVFYFFLIRPQKKEQKKMNTMLSELEIGDVVLTSGGFYGVLIDITEDTVIVEFGSNKNCRIPMKKTSIAQVEKPDTSAN